MAKTKLSILEQNELVSLYEKIHGKRLIHQADPIGEMNKLHSILQDYLKKHIKIHAQ